MNHKLGSVCKLKNSDTKIIIIGYNGKSVNYPNYIFNYVGVVYPIGYTDLNSFCYFNNEHVESIIFNGYDENTTIDNEIVASNVTNNVDNLEKKEDTTSENSASKEQNSTTEKKGNGTAGKYRFDENGFLIEFIPENPEPVQETSSQQQEIKPENNQPKQQVTLSNIDISNL